jgi:hypothetical protein
MLRRKNVKNPIRDADLLACMDLLHADIPDDDLEAACCYEYARESDVLLETAVAYKESVLGWQRGRSIEAKRRKKIGWPAPVGGSPGGTEVYLAVKEKLNLDVYPWFMDPPWSAVWSCPSFPGTAWLELGDSERADIRCAFFVSGKKARPLLTHDVTLLDSMGIFERFQKMSRLRRHGKDQCKAPSKGEEFPPIIQGWPNRKGDHLSHLFNVLFTLDFTKNRKQLHREFDAWLETPAIKQYRKKHERATIGKTGAFKDRLKDLAAWRLFRRLGDEDATAFANTNRKRDAAGIPRAFHDPRKGQSKEVPINSAPLYSEESGFRKAQARAKKYLGRVLPQPPVHSKHEHSLTRASRSLFKSLPAKTGRSNATSPTKWTDAQKRIMARRARRKALLEYRDLLLAGDF